MIRQVCVAIQIFDLLSTESILDMGGREYNALLTNIVAVPQFFIILKMLMVAEVFCLAWWANYFSNGTGIKGGYWVVVGASAACLVPAASNLLWLVGVGGL